MSTKLRDWLPPGERRRRRLKKFAVVCIIGILAVGALAFLIWRPNIVPDGLFYDCSQGFTDGLISGNVDLVNYGESGHARVELVLDGAVVLTQTVYVEGHSRQRFDLEIHVAQCHGQTLEVRVADQWLG